MDSGSLKMGLRLKMSAKVVICDKCSKEIEVRQGIFASATLSRHYKAEHK
jgi:anti-sigma factor ChrR (cupin superfamily)